jgi:uncharacterized membrane protein
VNDTVWERTHRLGSWLFVVVGLIGIITSFMPLLRFWAVIGGLLIITVILYVYSYLVYRHVVGDEGGPFSPPFDRQS